MPPSSGQRMNSQMIPTPGFNNNSNNQGFLNAESSNNSGRFSTAESATTMSYGQHQKLHVGSQNSGHVFHGQSNDVIQSGMQQRPYAFINGAPSAGVSVVGSNGQLADGVGSSDNTTAYGNSPKIPQHYFDQYQQLSLQGTFGNLF